MFFNYGLGDCWPSVSANVKGDADQRVKSGVNVDPRDLDDRTLLGGWVCV